MSDSDIQTFAFQPDYDGSLSLESAVFQALGAASICWDPMDGTGIFQSERAKAIGDALIEKISQQYPNIVGDFIDIGPGCFSNKEETVISYKGNNFYRSCDVEVRNFKHGGKSFCVKPVGHPSNIHEDYRGNLKGE